MKRFIAPLVALAAGLFIVASPTSASVTPSALPPLPDGYDEFVPTFDFQELLGSQITGASLVDMSCIVDSAVGTNLFSGSDPEFTVIERLADMPVAFSDPNADVVLECGLELGFPREPQEISGTISNPAMTEFLGTSSGAINMFCDIDASPNVTIQMRFGGAVPGGADVTAIGADSQIPFVCNMLMIFEGEETSSLMGSVDGALEIFNPFNSTSLCNRTRVISCVAIRLQDARVEITSASGKFEGYVGTGAFSFQNQFTLPSIDSLLSMAGVSPARLSDTKLAASKRTGRNALIWLELEPGRNRASIVHPYKAPGRAMATIRDGEQIVVVSSQTGSCVISARRGTGTWKRVAQVGLNQDGAARLSLSGANLVNFKSTGVIRNGVVTLRAACGPSRTWTDTKQVKYLGR